MEAEFGVPQWTLGTSTFAYAGPDRIVCAYSKAGLGRLAVLDLRTQTLTALDTPFTDSARCARQATARCFAPVLPTIPSASSRSISLPAGPS